MTVEERRAKRRARQKARSRRRIFFFGFLLVLILLTGLLFRVVSGLLAAEEPEPEVYDPHAGMVEVPYGDSTIWITPYDNLPTRSWAQSDFETDDNGFITYTGSQYTVLTGVDVSSHQGDIDWQAAADAGVQFAYLRAGYRGYTEGILHEDSCFAQNLKGACDAGIQCGVYFYSQALSEDEASEEAEFLAELLEEHREQITLPVCFDWENDSSEGSRTLTADPTMVNGYAKAFCSVLEEAGWEVCLYFNRSMGYYCYRLGEFDDCSFWCAETTDWPTFYYATRLWQYTDEGSVAGFDTPVDLDLMFLQP